MFLFVFLFFLFLLKQPGGKDCRSEWFPANLETKTTIDLLRKL